MHIEKKPATRQERKAAHKRRDAQIAAKEAERKRKAAEREREARIAAGEMIEEEKPLSMGDKLKKSFGLGKPAASATPAAPAASAATPASAPKPTASRVPNTPEYRRYKRIYWILMGVGIVSIALSFGGTFLFPGLLEGAGTMVPMGIAYAAVIGAIVLDYTKIRKMQKAHTSQMASGKQSPKQQKHEMQKAEAAALLEESRKAQRELKRANSKVPFLRKPKEVTEKAEDAEGAAGAVTDAKSDGKNNAADTLAQSAVKSTKGGLKKGITLDATAGSNKEGERE